MYKKTVSIFSSLVVAIITATIPSVAYGVACQKTSGIKTYIYPGCGVKLLAQNQSVSSNLDKLLRQGRALADAGKYQKAITIYQQAARLDPKNAQIYSGIAYLEALQGNFQAASQFYQQAIAIEPHKADFQYGLGYSMAKLENYQAAVEAYRRASLLDRNNVNAHLGLGAALFRLEKYNEAIIAYQVAIQSNSNNAEAYASMGLTLLKQER
ncbi:tetratricopeptide repeat protein [Okeania hirsuta]|uniref:Tetratricopeptide repeat protein n=2 Tax=Microcoleaceae TaxID=1892252 RepID=A0A3N6PYC8_9CYAN|nr:tetratricopeptide repeat protein [Okeania hirsuta]RQH47543.1 tetratricopeptide repeat protein [Okeania hirsuta]